MDDPANDKQIKNMKILATLDTADFNDCVNTGYRFNLYSDGHLSATYSTRWQGSRDGARYITDPAYVDVSTIDASDDDHDALALLTSAVQDVQPSDDRGWRQVRRGWIVR
jgi:hypothetical protein